MDALTPMLRQYRQVKAEHPDAILMFRLGDFYEMFFDDALVASKALALTLTARGRGTAAEAPMCGVPYHAADGYIARLVGGGHRVAICDQVEDPRQAKGIVKREVTRVVSPGTLTDPAHLPAREPSFIAAVAWDGAATTASDRGPDAPARSAAAFGCALLDLSTGEFRVSEHRGRDARAALVEHLASFGPREIVVREGGETPAWLWGDREGPPRLTVVPSWRFGRDGARSVLLERFGTASLEGFGVEGKDLAIAAAGALVAHLQDTQKTDLKHVIRVVWNESGGSMNLDAATRRTLEIVENARDGGRDGTLLEVVDRTRTSAGGRMLRDWLLRPLVEVEAIESRLEAVAELASRPQEREALGDHLERVHDLERLLARAALGTANARDLVALRDSLGALPALASRAAGLAAPLLTRLLGGLDALPELHALLASALADDPPVSVREAGILRDGFDAEADGLRALRRDSQGVLLQIEARERERTGIGSLKVRYNKVFGYYLEVGNAHRARVPADYDRKQTLVGAERYITPELKDLEHKVLTAADRLAEIEYAAFVRLRDAVASEAARLKATAVVVATVDALRSLAETAQEQGWTRPSLDTSTRLVISEG
ncbi:MAG TPA: DNA mismatch repair protein MutS, partial [Candidatus Polarisedimenticolia bacterium]|nr:DNA mismatch repair protein MutS [Candidatus Polarisedimenticolia bacterium]